MEKSSLFEPLSGLYYFGAFAIGIIVFLIVWFFALFRLGFLLGISIGWFPAAIAGLIAGFLWPLVIILIIGIVVLINHNQTTTTYTPPQTQVATTVQPQAVASETPFPAIIPSVDEQIASNEASAQDQILRQFFHLLDMQQFTDAFAIFSDQYQQSQDFSTWRAGYNRTLAHAINTDYCNNNQCTVELTATEIPSSNLQYTNYVFRYDFIQDTTGNWRIDNGVLVSRNGIPSSTENATISDNSSVIDDASVPTVVEQQFESVYGRKPNADESYYWKYRARSDKNTVTSLHDAMLYWFGHGWSGTGIATNP